MKKSSFSQTESKGEMMMPLTMANAGEQNYIKKITGKDDIRRHLANLGFVVGQSVTVICKLGGNLILCVKDSRVALDQGMANRIIV
jgi:ferrous iron transport protein A